MAPSLISRINQTTHLTPVILSGAPERFVCYQDHWRAVEGSRERVLYHTASGSSHENANAARCGLGGFFLRDRSWPTPLDAFHFLTPQDEIQALVGQSTGRNSLRQHGGRQFLGILRLRAHHFLEAPTRRGASLRMTQATRYGRKTALIRSTTSPQRFCYESVFEACCKE
jgi:hypothetical protein